MHSEIVRDRLCSAVDALRVAGAEKLPGMLEEAFEHRSRGLPDHGDTEAVLRQARAWATVSGEDLSPSDVAKRVAARDALGALWAVLDER